MYMYSFDQSSNDNKIKKLSYTKKTETVEGKTTSSLEPGQDVKPHCPSTDPPSISGQSMDF